MDTRFERGPNEKSEWLTPPYIIKALGEFDLDPCSPIKRPWDTASKHFTIEDDGLSKQWKGRVWCNPPYGNQLNKWLQKMASHNNGIALVSARTDTDNFTKYIWLQASGILFLRRRVAFYHVNGSKGAYTSGAPSCLVAYGEANLQSLLECGINGAVINLDCLDMSGETLPLLEDE